MLLNVAFQIRHIQPFKNSSRAFFCFFVLLQSALSFLQAQTADVSVAEKIYIQLPSKVYATDQTIWFKAVVVNSNTQNPTSISGVLYVDLINPNKQIIDQKTLKLKEGLGQGAFELNSNLNSGKYQIRAYTNWNRNFSADFMFKAYVDVVDAEDQSNKTLTDSLQLFKSQSSVFLNGVVTFENLKKNRSKETLKAFLDWGKGRDTLNIKKSKGRYRLNYKLPKQADWVNLTIDKGFGVNYSKRLIVDKNAYHIQFFPESGKMLHGVLNKLGVKVLAPNGKGKSVTGHVFDEQGTLVTMFKTNHLGMGVLTFRADSSKTYHAKVVLPEQGLIKKQYQLPKAVAEGSVFSIVRDGKPLKLKVNSSDADGVVYLKVSLSGEDYYWIEGKLKNHQLLTQLDLKDLPEGIAVFTLMDEHKNPIAERLFFNTSKKDRLNVNINTDKTNYKNREKVALQIDVKDSGKQPLENQDISVVAIHKSNWRDGLDETIRSYFLLNSELRGKVEDPGYYFKEDNSKRLNDLDALLLTQGWRNYVYPIKRESSSFFPPETSLSVKGSVVSNLSRKKIINDTTNVSMLLSGKVTCFNQQTTDSSGKFQFLLPDIHGKPIKAFIQAKGIASKPNRYKLILEKQSFPEVKYEVMPEEQNLKTIKSSVITNQKKRNRVKKVFDSIYGVTELDEVLVKAYKMTPLQKLVSEKYGETDVVITGDSIRKKEKKWSYGLFSVLLFNYPGQIMIEQFPDGFMLAHIIAGKKEPTLIMIDGRLIREHEYEQVPHMSPKIIEQIDLIKYANHFKSRYLEVFTDAHPLGAPSLGHIISIYTKGGIGLYASKPSPGTITTSVPVFSPVKEFYVPISDKENSSSTQIPNYKPLLYWNAFAKTNENGQVSKEFYNGDLEGDYVIIVEAISKDGRIGYQYKEYRVGE